MGCDSLVIKDMAGIISPKRAKEIIEGIKAAGIDLPLELHSHCSSGMTEMAYMEAIHAGIDILDTCMSPLLTVFPSRLPNPLLPLYKPHSGTQDMT